MVLSMQLVQEILEVLMREISVLTIIQQNVFQHISIDYFWVFLAVGLVLSSYFLIIKKEFCAYHMMVKKHKILIKFLYWGLGVFISCKIYKTSQYMIYFVEYCILYFYMDYEFYRDFEYQLNIKGNESNYVEKAVAGKGYLTKSQKIVLDNLIDLIDKRSQKDSYNIGLIGAWGCGKTSITDTLINEFQNRNKKEKQYFMLKIGALTLNEMQNVVIYVKEYIENLFNKYEIDSFWGNANVAFLNTLVEVFGNVSSLEHKFTEDKGGFIDLEQEREYFEKQIQKLLKISGRKNIIFIIDDVDRSDEENKIIQLLVEFSSINGIISIISLDKKKDINIRPTVNNTDISDESIYNSLDKYIHIRVRIDTDKLIEYDEAITQQILCMNEQIQNEKNSFIDCEGDNNRTSLFDTMRDWSTTYKINQNSFIGSQNSLLIEIFFYNLRNNKKKFGEYLEEVIRDYLYSTKEINKYLAAMIRTPIDKWNIDLHKIRFQWTDAFEYINWLEQLQQNAYQIFFAVCQEMEALNSLIFAQNNKLNHVPDDIENFDDIYEWEQLRKCPIPGRTWENRKENPTTYAGLEEIRLLLFDKEEWKKINKTIRSKDYELAKKMLMNKGRLVCNFYLVVLVLTDFMEYFRNVLNNYRTLKMQLREAEFVKLNYLDYLIKEWSPRKKLFDDYEKLKEALPIVKELETGMPNLNHIINNIFYEEYILKFGTRFKNNELEKRRMHLCTLGDKKIIVLSRKNEEIKDTIILDMNGEEIEMSTLNTIEIEKIKEAKEFIWSENKKRI